MKKVQFDFDEIRNVIKNSSPETSIYVACDSAERGNSTTFVTVVVVHFDSCHGGQVFKEIIVEPKRLRMRDKLLAEVYKSVETALLITDSVGERKLQVHLDVSPDKKYGSNIVFKEGMSYVKAYGLDAVAKHESWAAYCCADHLAKLTSKRKRRLEKKH